MASTTTVRKERGITSERVLSTLMAIHKRYELNRTMSKLAFQNRDMSNVEFVATLKKLYNYHLSKKMCRSLFAWCLCKTGHPQRFVLHATCHPGTYRTHGLLF